MEYNNKDTSENNEKQNKLPLTNMNITSIAKGTIQNVNNIVDDIIYMNVSPNIGFKGYLFEILDIMTKDDRLLYTGILLSFIALVIMILDYFNF